MDPVSKLVVDMLEGLSQSHHKTTSDIRLDIIIQSGHLVFVRSIFFRLSEGIDGFGQWLTEITIFDSEGERTTVNWNFQIGGIERRA